MYIVHASENFVHRDDMHYDPVQIYSTSGMGGAVDSPKMHTIINTEETFFLQTYKQTNKTLHTSAASVRLQPVKPLNNGHTV